MLGFFPDPYEDELLWSAFARYSDQVNFPNKVNVWRDLFGVSYTPRSIEFPTRLNLFVNNLPCNHSYTADYLIAKHTLLPFYSPFLAPERLEKTLQIIKEGADESGTQPISFGTSPIRSVETLRYCPLCSQEDYEKYGEYYWHRSHQLPAINCCTKHCVFLEESNVVIRYSWENGDFVPANRVIQPNFIREMNLDNIEHLLMLTLAQNAVWLLESDCPCFGPYPIFERYHNALGRQGFISRGNRVRSLRLIQAFLNKYNSEFLRDLYSDIADDWSKSWLMLLTRKPRRNQLEHPIRHLLFINFLGYSAKAFFQDFASHSPFGSGPWPCLNPVCIQHFQPCILEITTEFTRYVDGRITGIFTCPVCNFSYKRRGPDMTEDDHFHYTRILDYGPVWKNKLSELWRDPLMSVNKMAPVLGVSRQTITYQVQKLGFLDNNPLPDKRRNTPPSIEYIQECRNQWLSIRKEYPFTPIKHLKKIVPLGFYNILRRYDKDWLSEHSDDIKEPEKTQSSDLSSLDMKLVQQLISVSNELKSNRKQRLSKSALLKRLSNEDAKLVENGSLPLSNVKLHEVIETTEEFAIRRIKIIIEECIEQGVHLTRSKLISRAGVKAWIGKSKKVEQSISEGLCELDET